MSLCRGILMCLCVLMPLVAGAQPLSYTFAPLPAELRPRALDRTTSRVVGTRLVAGEDHAARFVTLLQTLGTLPGGFRSQAHAVRGDTVCGESATGALGLRTHPFCVVLPDETSMPALIALPTAAGPDHFATVTAVNTSDTKGGFGDAPDRSRIVPLLWDTAATVTILPTLAPDEDGFVYALNEAGDAAGEATMDGHHHAALWPASGGLLDLHPGGDGESQFVALVDGPKAVGTLTEVTQTRGLSYDASGVVLLAPLPGQAHSRATGLNSAGYKVGQSLTPGACAGCPATSVATLWTPANLPVDVATLVTLPAGWELRNAFKINDEGVILVMGTADGVVRSALLVPQPPGRSKDRPPKERHPRTKGRDR